MRKQFAKVVDGVVCLDERQFVKSCPDVACGSLLKVVGWGEEMEVVEVACSFGEVALLDRKIGSVASQGSFAKRVERALVTQGFRRQANERAKFHDGLVVQGGLSLVKMFVGKGCEMLFAFRRVDGCGVGVQSRKHSKDVSVEHGVGEVEGKRRNGGCCVGSYPGERENVVVGGGKRRKIRGDEFGGLEQVARA